MTLFFNLKGTSFSDIFDSMKNEQAMALPSFSHGPHSKQDNVSRILQILDLVRTICPSGQTSSEV